MKAEEYINLGYQRLLTFEAPDGGFSLYGDPPGDIFLSAYGLMEIHDMAQVFPVDEALIARTAEWLMSQQNADGTWSTQDYRVGGQTFAATAYTVWSLNEAGYGDDARAQKGLGYVKEYVGKAQAPYELALAANALVAAEPQGQATLEVLDRLAAMAKEDDGAFYWEGGIESFMGASGQQNSIETTALVAYAFIKADAHPDLANGALTYLVRNKDSFGTWSTTQATILSLKALIASTKAGAEKTSATVQVSLNGEEVAPIEVSAANYDVVQLVTFTDKPVEGDNTVRIAVEGEGNPSTGSEPALMYQVSTEYWLPWDAVPVEAPEKEPITINVAYDRTELAMNGTAVVDVEVNLNVEGVANMAIVDLGIPPGFSVVAEDLDNRVQRDLDKPADYTGVRIKRYEITGRQIIVYVENLTYGEPLTFSYRLLARYPISAQAPASTAYDYYNPDVSSVAQPQVMVVSE